jgi:hypothetical protein
MSKQELKEIFTSSLESNKNVEISETEKMADMVDGIIDKLINELTPILHPSLII